MKLKQVIEGVSYNTETATILGRRKKDGVTETLYQTPTHDFFMVEEQMQRVWNPRSGTYQDRPRTALTPKSPDELKTWFSHHGTDRAKIGDNRYEAVLTALKRLESRGPIRRKARIVGSTVIYVRMPMSLKARIEAAAAKANTSVNVWALRAFERICDEQEREEKTGGEKPAKERWPK